MSILYNGHENEPYLSQRPYSVHFVLIKPQYTTPHSVNMKNKHRESHVLYRIHTGTLYMPFRPYTISLLPITS